MKRSSMVTIGSLCAGIGGLDLGVAWGLGTLGFSTSLVWQVERDEYCQKILARHFPEADRTVTDVCDAGRHNLAPVDVVCAGFPCQPVAYSGRRRARADARWLWPKIERVVRELGPRLVFLENVPGLLTADDGHAFGEVLGDLAALGFDAEWDCVRADVVGAPQKRARVFLLADRNGVRELESQRGEREEWGRSLVRGESRAVGDAAGERAVAEEQPRSGDGALGAGEALADPDARVQQRGATERVRGRAVSAVARVRGEGRTRGSAAEPGLGRDAHGAPGGLDRLRWPAGRGEPQHPWEPPRTAAKVPFRPERLRALGNAVVPAQAAYAFRSLWARRVGS